VNQLQGMPDKYLADAINGFFANGGSRCYVARVAAEQNGETLLTAWNTALKALAPLGDLDLIALPDAVSLSPQQTIQVQQAALKHCAEQGDRLAILDALPGSTVESVKQQRRDIVQGQKDPINGAIYFPWLKNHQGRLIPPCGHIAGIVARSDRNRGVFKAPANEEIFDALDLQINIDAQIQDQLNPEGINCLRTFPGRGIRVWGARTLSRDPNWRYISTRRLFLTLGRWIDRNMQWATFEPNSPRLWVRIQRELSSYLEGLWREGALLGATPEQAFFVKCDAETNPPENREIGSVVTQIGLAANSPAEFIVVRLVHRPNAVDIS
jgi:phage tail sheath protein FI